MAEHLDPYHEWLGISSKDRPSSHYHLLGIDPFEPSPSVIQTAADQRMAHLQTFQTGRNSLRRMADLEKANDWTCLFSRYFDGIVVHVRGGAGKVSQHTVYVAIGGVLSGCRSASTSSHQKDNEHLFRTSHHCGGFISAILRRMILICRSRFPRLPSITNLNTFEFIAMLSAASSHTRIGW